MNINEIKKEMYKQKPVAKFSHIRKGICYYSVLLDKNEVWFEIPSNDMGDADFTYEMPSQLLLRWIINKPIL